jgi:hypothetical protein
VRPLQPVDRSVSRDSVVANSEETATSGRQAFKNVRFQMIANNERKHHSLRKEHPLIMRLQQPAISSRTSRELKRDTHQSAIDETAPSS